MFTQKLQWVSSLAVLMGMLTGQSAHAQTLSETASRLADALLDRQADRDSSANQRPLSDSTDGRTLKRSGAAVLGAGGAMMFLGNTLLKGRDCVAVYQSARIVRADGTASWDWTNSTFSHERCQERMNYSLTFGGIATAAVGGVLMSMGRSSVTRSFDDLEGVLRPSDDVLVTDKYGRRLRGRLSSVSASSLVLTVEKLNGPSTRIFDRDMVKAVQRIDSTKNGALVGLAIGAVPLVMGLAWNNPYYGGIGVLTTALGPAVGWSIDRLVNQRVSISPENTAQVKVSPHITKHTQSVNVSFQF